MDSTHLINWFKSSQRDLPWRIDRSPYAVWVSEVMLQQTQVAVVVPYFERWMKQFPTIRDLACAKLGDVIKAWEGLGYYSRARNLHAGAQYVMQHYQGQLPEDYDSLKKIKGLGPYTIGAIQSFAFHKRSAAVDGNVIRVLTRLFCLQDDISKPATTRKIWELAHSVLPENEAWVFNEALIELGATVCTKKPQCSQCPLKANCKAFLQGKASQLPYKSAKIAIEELHRAVAIIFHGNKVLVKKGEKGKLMADLYEFPYFEIGNETISSKAFQKTASRWFGRALVWQQSFPLIKQSFTRYRAHLQPMSFACAGSVPPQNDCEWVAIDDLPKMAFSSGHRRILNYFISK